jgi:hypothetical protein
MPWLQFVMMAQRCTRFDARDYLRAIEGPAFSLPTENAGQRIVIHRELMQQAGYASDR